MTSSSTAAVDEVVVLDAADDATEDATDVVVDDVADDATDEIAAADDVLPVAARDDDEWFELPLPPQAVSITAMPSKLYLPISRKCIHTFSTLKKFIYAS